ncbi:hypothetical protein ES705_39482 [subsurface metagenome]
MVSICAILHFTIKSSLSLIDYYTSIFLQRFAQGERNAITAGSSIGTGSNVQKFRFGSVPEECSGGKIYLIILRLIEPSGNNCILSISRVAGT